MTHTPNTNTVPGLSDTAAKVLNDALAARNATTVTTDAKAYNEQGRHTGPGQWLAVIHAVNRVAPGTFGSPTGSYTTLGGFYVEVYDDAEVMHRTDREQVTVRSTTAKGAQLIADAAAELGLAC